MENGVNTFVGNRHFHGADAALFLVPTFPDFGFVNFVIVGVPLDGYDFNSGVKLLIRQSVGTMFVLLVTKLFPEFNVFATGLGLRRSSPQKANAADQYEGMKCVHGHLPASSWIWLLFTLEAPLSTLNLDLLQVNIMKLWCQNVD